jgi:predicted phosphodiesterase
LSNNNIENQKILFDYLRRFPKVPSLTIAKLAYKEHPMNFNSIEHARGLVRRYRGANGKKELRELANLEFISPEKLAEKYSLPEPLPIDAYEPFLVDSDFSLLFADSHIPFHALIPFNAMIDYGLRRQEELKRAIKALIILGDFVDMFDQSFFEREPNLSTLELECYQAQELIKALQKQFPEAQIYYKFGNHEKRMDSYIMRKAPELWDVPELKLHNKLKLDELNVKYISEDRFIDLNGLGLLHGHEYKNGLTSPANPARTTFLRTKASAVAAHCHQSSEHDEPNLFGSHFTTWGLGCMCNLNPKYMPLNKWNWGFGEHFVDTKEDRYWQFSNKKVLKSGRVV